MKIWTSLAAAACLSLAMLPAAQANTSANQGEYVSHTVDCLGMLLTDPAAHATQCGGPFSLPPGPSNTIAPGTYKDTGCKYTMIETFDFSQVNGELKVASNPCCLGALTPTPDMPFNMLLVMGERIDVAC